MPIDVNRKKVESNPVNLPLDMSKSLLKIVWLQDTCLFDIHYDFMRYM